MDFVYRCPLTDAPFVLKLCRFFPPTFPPPCLEDQPSEGRIYAIENEFQMEITISVGLYWRRQTKDNNKKETRQGAKARHLTQSKYLILNVCKNIGSLLGAVRFFWPDLGFCPNRLDPPPSLEVGTPKTKHFRLS